MRRDLTCFASSEHFLVFWLKNSQFFFLNLWIEPFYCSDLDGHSAPPLLRWPIWAITTLPSNPQHTHAHSRTINTTYYHLSSNTIPNTSSYFCQTQHGQHFSIKTTHNQLKNTAEGKHVHRSTINPTSKPASQPQFSPVIYGHKPVVNCYLSKFEYWL